jgi:hypothetical protein
MDIDDISEKLRDLHELDYIQKVFMKAYQAREIIENNLSA